MKTITVKQPWASLVVHGIKDIENRTWACPEKYIGKRVLIHASKSIPKNGWCEMSEHQIKIACKGGMIGARIEELPYGSIIGSVEIVGCKINHPSIWAEKTENYTVGMNPKIHEDITGKRVVWNWVLSNPVLFAEPIPAKGKLSFWDYPGIKEVKIVCPECGSIQDAIEDHTTIPFSTLIHECTSCEYMIMESEWEYAD